MRGFRTLRLIAVLAAMLIVACGRKPGDIAGTYLEVEALGSPAMLELASDGTGAFIVRLGERNVEDPFLWVHEGDAAYTLNYYDGLNELVATERFRLEDDVLMFDADNARFARVEDGAQIPAESAEAPFPIFQ